MTDDDLRELERRWRSSGAAVDEAAWLAASVRAGGLTVAALRLRAFIGDPAARLAVGEDATPREVDPPAPVADALDRLADAFAVVVHARFEPAGAPEDEAAHELVARLTARAFGEADAAVRRSGATRGARVALAELLGDRVDVARRILLFPSPGGLLPAAEATASRAAGSGWGSSLVPGYGHALSDPPYGLRLPLEEVARLFDVVWTGLVGAWDDGEVVAYSWSTEAWPAYDPGHEWWGSPLWTIAPRDGRPWVGLTASATD